MTRMVPYKHQHEITERALEVLREHALVYLAMEERTGKSLISIMVCEETRASRVLILTKIKAMEGWEETINGYIHLNSYTVANYHSAHKVIGKFDVVILDEPHAYISGYPKPAKIWKAVQKLCRDLPLIYLSATPNAQGTQLLYHQFAISSWGPWKKYKDFYEWFKHFARRKSDGSLPMKYIGPNRQAIDYTAVDHERVMETVKHLFITKTRAELGFEQEPEDELHYIELNESTKAVYNELIKNNVLSFTHGRTGKDYTVVCDTPIKLRVTLHQIEGGALKYVQHVRGGPGKVVERSELLVLGNREKVEYIKERWGDSSDVVIMYEYNAEKVKLDEEFKNASILQASTYAEGVDLSGYKHLIVYSQNFSTSKYTQRRARQANMQREDEIKVHFLLVKKAISDQVYNTVAVNKTNFVDSYFEREEL